MWYDENVGQILIIICLLILTDISIITTIFTSQIFGLTLFYSPMSLKGINMINIASIISLFIEHIPQFITQFYVVFYKNQYFSTITMCALIVSCIDIVFAILRVAAWGITWKYNKPIKKISMVDLKKQHLLQDEQ